MDSGAFSTIARHGGYPRPVHEYAGHIKRWRNNGNLLAAVAQDYMCEPQMLAKTGLTVADHQRLTIERYDDLLRCETGCYTGQCFRATIPMNMSLMFSSTEIG